MFTNLLRNEWKNGTVPLICLGAGLGTLLLNLALVPFYSPFAVIVRILLAIFSMLAGCGLYYAIMIICAVRWHGTMFAKQGYLTRALPVTNTQLLFSKLIPSVIYMFVAAVEMLAIVMTALCSIIAISFGSVAQGSVSFAEGWSSFAECMSNIFQVFPVPMIVVLAALLLLQAINMILIPYLGITIANCGSLQKNNVVFSLLFSFGLFFADQILSAVCMLAVPVWLKIGINGDPTSLQFGYDWLAASVSMNNPTSMVSANVSSGFGLGIFISLLGVMLVAGWLTLRLLQRKAGVK